MSGYRQKIGAWGENAAAAYLEERGYTVLARNQRTPYGEIDILAEKDGFFHFIEVKARTTAAFGPPEIAITPRKQEHMRAAAEYYAAEYGFEHWQIDVIAVERKSEVAPTITHFENAI